MIEKDVRDWLVTQLGTTAIYHTAVPQGVGPQAITMVVTGKDRAYWQAQASTICLTAFNMTAWVQSPNELEGYYTAKANAEQLRETLELYPDAMGDSKIYSVMIENESDASPQYLEGNSELIIGVSLVVKIYHTQA